MAPSTQKETHFTVDLKTGRKIVLSVPRGAGLDSEKISITITHEVKAGRLARLTVVAPVLVKIDIP